MEYGSAAPVVAFALAVVSGSLLAAGMYIGGGVTGVLAVLLLWLWRRAERKGEDSRHTLW